MEIWGEIRRNARYTLVGGTVSERPKVQLSKSCVGESPPWVQIPPVPPCRLGDHLTYDPSFPIEGSFQLPKTAEQKALGIVALLRRFFLEDKSEAV